MKVYVETLDNEIISDYVFKGYIGAKNAGYETIKMDLCMICLLDRKELLNELSMPIGSIEYCKWFMEYIYNVPVPDPLNIPDFLNIDDSIKIVKSRKDLEYPIFVKPNREHKKFTGFVAKSEKDWDLYPEIKDWDGELWIRRPFYEKIESEWRFFINKKKIVNVSCYSGDPTLFPEDSIVYLIEHISKDNINKLPISYSIDMACTENEDYIVELNDAWGLGVYGCNEDDYFSMLKNRWNQIINTNL